MKKIIFLLAFTMAFLTSKSQNQPSKLMTDSSDRILFAFKLADGSEVATSQLIIRTHEIASLIPIPQQVFEKKPYFKKKASAFTIVPKSNVVFISLNEILARFKINQVEKGWPVILDGKIVPDSGKNIYASKDAVQSVTTDALAKVIRIKTKPELKNRKK